MTIKQSNKQSATYSRWTLKEKDKWHDHCFKIYNFLTVVIIVFPLAPSRAPYLVTAHSPSSTSLVVEWSHLSEKQFRGKPIGYNVIYFPVGSERDINFLQVKYPVNTTTLTYLAAYTKYFINVLAVSSGGIGPGKAITTRTSAAGTLH